MPEHAIALSVGSCLGPYEIVSAIGAGGMGEVYRARDTRLNRTVAIKVVSEAFAGDPSRRARFEREAQAVAALSHPNICALHDVGEAPGPPSVASTEGAGASLASSEIIRYLVMECLEGQTLAERLVRGPLAMPDVLRYASELADALDHAHRRGLIHRDVKPGNVMVTRDGAKLLDFGLRMEVYVGAFPVQDSRSRVSTDGGIQPRWRRDGKELFYLAPDGTIMSASVDAGPTFAAGTPRPLFRVESTLAPGAGWNPSYIPSADGRRFLINVHETEPSPVAVVLNWPGALGGR